MKLMSYFMLCLSLSSFQSAFTQSTKESSFISAAKTIVERLTHRDSAGLSKFIDKKTGVYIVYSIGIRGTYKHFATIGFSDSTSLTALLYPRIVISKMNYSSLPTYDCIKWSKTGTFVDTLHTDHLLSKTAKRLNLYNKANISQKQIEALQALEGVSRRVVIADNHGKELIFYLGFINNKWVLTIIDKLTTDCSV
jgi:hypothetical protein